MPISLVEIYQVISDVARQAQESEAKAQRLIQQVQALEAERTQLFEQLRTLEEENHRLCTLIPVAECEP